MRRGAAVGVGLVVIGALAAVALGMSGEAQAAPGPPGPEPEPEPEDGEGPTAAQCKTWVGAYQYWQTTLKAAERQLEQAVAANDMAGATAAQNVILQSQAELVTLDQLLAGCPNA